MVNCHDSWPGVQARKDPSNFVNVNGRHARRERHCRDAAPVAPRDDEGALREEYVERVVQALDAGDTASLRELVGDLHEADLGA